MCKGPEVGACWWGSRSSKAVSVTETWVVKGRVTGRRPGLEVGSCRSTVSEALYECHGKPLGGLKKGTEHI